MLGMLALSKTLEKPEPIHPNQAENMSAESYSKMDLLSENYTGQDFEKFLGFIIENFDYR